MKTINQLISETCSTRKARMETVRDERISEVYRRFPELERIDTVIFKTRRNSMMRVMQGLLDADMVVTDEMRNLDKKRREFICSHNIDENFDGISPECNLCGDTGYIKKKSLTVVCSCMSKELIEAYNEAGLKDFNSVVPKGFKADYIPSSAERRAEVHKTLVSILSSISEGKSHPVYIYSDGAQTGKTYLSVVVTKIAITLGLSAIYTKCEDLAVIPLDTLEQYKACELLIIDDYVSGVTRARSIASNLNSILEVRKNRGLATVIVSNESTVEMVENSDERIAGKLTRAVSI